MRIGVVGSGGAGITAAWLLDERHDVTLFEKNPVLGGHARTTRVERDGHVHFADDGFSWFSDALYPTFLRLLELHAVPTRIIPMSATFTQLRRRRTFVLPPTGLGKFLGTVLNVPKLVDLLRLNRAIGLATPMVHARDQALTWGEFVARHRFDATFNREMLTPMVAGVWGGPYERVNDFAAYTLMKYLVFHRPSGLTKYRWHVLRDGAASYPAKVAESLKRATVLRNTMVTALERTASGWTVRDSAGAVHAFDHVVMATGARDAQKILVDVRGVDSAKRIVNDFEYYSVRLATHSDPAFMPPNRSDWRVGNIAWDGTRSNLTIWVGAHTGSDVFTSYLGEREPKECHHVSTFHLPLITPAHHRAQQALAEVNGRENLWFMGDWTRDIGCHEDAVVSAVRVCEKLDPQLARLDLLASPRVHPPLLALPERASA